jgi:hypothetical protein
MSIAQMRCVGSALTINRSVQHIGIQCVGFVKSEVLTEANIQIMAYWHVTPFSLVHRYQNFGGNCRPPEDHTHNRILVAEIPLIWYVHYFLTWFKLLVYTSFQTFTLKLLILKRPVQKNISF